MRTIRTALIVALGLALSSPAWAENPVPIPGAGRTLVNAPVKTFVQMRFRGMVQQAYDVSCGAAALATLLKYYYGHEDVTEQGIIDHILESAEEETKAKIQKDGFSMLELKKEGERFGLKAGGFRIPNVEDLVNLKVPAITLTNTRGYDHFVVIRGIANGEVHIADPAFGNRTKSLQDFADEWGNVILVFLSADNGGNVAFTRGKKLRGRSDQVISLIDRGIPTVSPLPGEF